MLHSVGEVDGATLLCPHLYVGGSVEHASDLVQCGEAEADNFKFLQGHSAWGKGQLEMEVERQKLWFAVGTEEPQEALLALNQDADEHVWAQTMHMLGGEFVCFAELVGKDTALVKELASNSSAFEHVGPLPGPDI